MRIAPFRAGLALGAAMAAVHLLWSVLVMTGWAQALSDFIFWIHFIRPPYTIMPFDLGRAGLLVLVTGGAGLILGSVLAVIWNALQPRPER